MTLLFASFTTYIMEGVIKMIKFKQGTIGNPNTGVSKDVIVKAASPNSLKDVLIGGGMVLVGIAYLTTTAFKNGSKTYEEAEMQVFEDLELFLD